MEKTKRWPFDVPIPGIPDQNLNVEKLMQAFHACKNTDPETANEIALHAVYCGNPSAKLAYSKFLRTTPSLAMPQAQRYHRAETMLLELLNLPDAPDRFSGEAALELGSLYADCLHRPAGALSLFLYAKRLGATVDEHRLTELRRKLERMDVTRLCASSADALRLGRELNRAGTTPQLAELFLREAVDKAAGELSAGRKGAENLYGQACLALGDFYAERLGSCDARDRMIYRIERDSMYAAARAKGYPEYLRKSDPVR